MLTHATIIPLIGGMSLAHDKVLKSKPKWILSYSAFKNNEKHLLEYYKHSIPYSFIDESPQKYENVDIISTVCPCAGLSSLSPRSSSESKMNDWMYKSAEHILENYSPTVFWGENAPFLATNKGFPVLKKLHKIGKSFGYTLWIYQTASKYHGNPQIRNRSFYFFWKGNSIPKFSWFDKPRRKLLDVLDSIPKGSTQQEILANQKIPSKDQLYETILEFEKLNHVDFIKKNIHRTCTPLNYIQEKELFDKSLEVVKQKEYKIALRLLERAQRKFMEGKGVMDKGMVFPGEYIGAFVGNLPTGMVHPLEDRYLNIRECLTLMDLPFDFELQEPIYKNINHICQNVPMNTAVDMVTEIVESINGKREFINCSDNIVISQNNHTEKLKTIEIEPRSLSY